ncbi:MAG: hypothetical protein CUN55_20445, partial [Phototrophicales bacterium]
MPIDATSRIVYARPILAIINIKMKIIASGIIEHVFHLYVEATHEHIAHFNLVCVVTEQRTGVDFVIIPLGRFEQWVSFFKASFKRGLFQKLFITYAVNLAI